MPPAPTPRLDSGGDSPESVESRPKWFARTTARGPRERSSASGPAPQRRRSSSGTPPPSLGVGFARSRDRTRVPTSRRRSVYRPRPRRRSSGSPAPSSAGQGRCPEPPTCRSILEMLLEAGADEVFLTFDRARERDLWPDAPLRLRGGDGGTEGRRRPTARYSMAPPGRDLAPRRGRPRAPPRPDAAPPRRPRTTKDPLLNHPFVFCDAEGSFLRRRERATRGAGGEGGGRVRAFMRRHMLVPTSWRRAIYRPRGWRRSSGSPAGASSPSEISARRSAL